MILYIIVAISILLNIILGIKVIMLQKELEEVKKSYKINKGGGRKIK